MEALSRRFNWSRDAWFHAASKVEDAAKSRKMPSDMAHSSQDSVLLGGSTEAVSPTLAVSSLSPSPEVVSRGRRSASLSAPARSGEVVGSHRRSASSSAPVRCGKVDQASKEEPVMHLARLVVDAEAGAGLEVSWAPSQGYVIEGIADHPSQPELCVGDLLIAINSHSLALSSEDAADEVLAGELIDGAELVLWRGMEGAGQKVSVDVVDSQQQEKEALQAASSGPVSEVGEALNAAENAVESADAEMPSTSAQAPMPELVPLPGLSTKAIVRQCHGGSSTSMEPNDWIAPTMPAASSSTASPCQSVVLRDPMIGRSAEPPQIPSAARCKIRNLWEWLQALNLDEYYAPAVQWCVEMGAASLHEVAENSEDFAESLGLKPIERKRLARWAADTGEEFFDSFSSMGISTSSGPLVAVDSRTSQKALMPSSFAESRTVQFLTAPDMNLTSSPAAVRMSDAASRALMAAQTSMRRSPYSAQAAASMTDPCYDSGLSLAHLSRPSGSNSLGPPLHQAFRNEAEAAAEDPSVLGPGPSGLRGDVTLYCTRKVSLKVDSEKGAGLDVTWDSEWGYVVQTIAATPGQPDLKQGDLIFAINGHSLRHRTADEVDDIFASQFAHGAILSVANPCAETTTMQPAHVLSRKGINRTPGLLVQQRRGLQQTPQTSGGGWIRERRGKMRRSGYDPNRMWQRFRGPPW